MPVHLYPEDDVFDHDTDNWTCLCGPKREIQYGPNGTDWLITHHSMDGREHRDGLAFTSD